MKHNKKPKTEKRGDDKFNAEENEKKRVQRVLQLAVRGLEKEGVTDYVVKVWPR